MANTGHEDEFIQVQEGLEYNDEEDDDGNLMNRILAVSNKNRHGSRTEFAPEVSQFHASVDNKVELFELIKGLGKKTQHSSLKKQISRVEKREKVLDVPLPRHQLDQITRVVQYEKTSKDVTAWEPVVQKNRKAEQLKFPLNQPDLKMHQTLSQFVNQQHKPRTALELEVAAMLKQEQPIVEAVVKPLSKVEEAALKAMSLREAKLKRAELQKNKMREAFIAAKLRLQGKIKSKKFHKIRRRAREKQEQKRLEQMSTADAEAYRDWVHKAEKQRIQERMTLKHKGSSRFMQRQTRFGKYNLATRQAVQDMLQQSQSLRNKVNVDMDDEDDGGLTSSDESAVNDPAAAATKHDVAKLAESDDDSDVNEEFIVESTTRKRTMEDLEEDDESNDDEFADKMEMEQVPSSKRLRSDTNSKVPKEKNKTTEKKRKTAAMIDPAQFMTVERDLSSASGVDLMTSGADDEESSNVKVAMAFAEDDDVLAEFEAEKKNIVERERPKDIDLRLPGWGEWSGPGIVASRQSKRRKKRFVIKAPPAPPRKDRDLGNVIISEAKDTAVAKHQVNALPFPYKNVVDFEKRIRQPVGRAWNSVATFKKLTKPKIVTKLGQVIAPIDKAETFKKATFDVMPAESMSKGKNRTHDFDAVKKSNANKQRAKNGRKSDKMKK